MTFYRVSTSLFYNEPSFVCGLFVAGLFSYYAVSFTLDGFHVECTVTLLRGNGNNILVDTGSAWDAEWLTNGKNRVNFIFVSCFIRKGR